MTDADSIDVHRTLGRLEARTDNTEAAITRIEEKVDTLLSFMQQNKGGIRTLFAVGSASAAIAAGIAELYHAFKVHP